MKAKVAVAMCVLLMAILAGNAKKLSKYPAVKTPKCSMDGGFTSTSGRQFMCVQNPATFNFICTCVVNCDSSLVTGAGSKTADGSAYTWYRGNFTDPTMITNMDVITCDGEHRLFKFSTSSWTEWKPM